MRDEQVRELMSVHYYIMQHVSPSIWYDELLRKMDAQICVAASNLRLGANHV